MKSHGGQVSAFRVSISNGNGDQGQNAGSEGGAAASSTTTATAVPVTLSRRAHNKSRGGCEACKRRRRKVRECADHVMVLHPCFHAS